MKNNEEVKSFLELLADLEKEKGISKEVVLETVKSAVSAAYKKNYGTDENIEVHIEDDGEIKVFTTKTVVETVEDPAIQISLTDAKLISKTAKLESEIVIEENCEEFRRNAVQNAKQIIIQRIREEERNTLLNKFETLKGQIVTGTVKHIDKYGNVYVDLGEIESFLPPKEQIPSDVYKLGQRLKVYVADVVNATRFPKVLISRKDSGFLEELLRFEIPEIEDGIVKIIAVARDAGKRSKVAVYTEESNIDPVGACIGASGSRIKAVLEEVYPEKIDVVEWSSDPNVFIANSLKPAKVISVDIDEEGVAFVNVEKDQLSLAIGKHGQNARLSAKLSNVRINIICPEEEETEQKEEQEQEEQVKEVQEVQEIQKEEE